MLNMPILLPKELRVYEGATSEEELATQLIKRPDLTTQFLEYSLEDETWSSQHSVFTSHILKAVTEDYLLGNFPQSFAERLAIVIHEHAAAIVKFLPKSLTVQLLDHHTEINPLLLGTASPLFHDLIVHECQERGKREIRLSETLRDFEPQEEFILSGTVQNLWKKSRDEILYILRQASRWRIEGLSLLCQETVKRYIASDLVIDLLIECQTNKWDVLRNYCYQHLNELPYDVFFHPSSPEDLAFEFLQFSPTALTLFQRLKDFITILTVSKSLVENIHFSQAVQACPSLRLLDVTDSEVFSDEFLLLPRDLRGLKLSQCPWLTNTLFRKMIGRLPYLKELSLTSNPQLSAETWGALFHLKGLSKLDLSHCNQINDQDLKLILRSFPSGTDLILNECKKISDRAFFEMARSHPHFLTLDLSRCQIGDVGLIEIALRNTQLISLNLSRCENITERGVIESVKHATALKELNLTRCSLAPNVFRELQEINPFLKVIY